MARAPGPLTALVQVSIVLQERDKQVRMNVRHRIMAEMAKRDGDISRAEFIKIVEEATK